MKAEKEFYVIMTKFGFIKRCNEDYTTINEEHPLAILYNVDFTMDPTEASKYYSPTQSANKYSQSRKYHWTERTAEKWAEEIGGKLVKCKTIHETGIELRQGKWVNFEHKEFLVLDKEYNPKTRFKEFPYEELEVEDDE